MACAVCRLSDLTACDPSCPRRRAWRARTSTKPTPELTPIGRVESIEGNVLAVLLLGSVEAGMRIVSDDNRLGRTPRAGFGTVVDARFMAGAMTIAASITVDNAALLNASIGDYLFEMPPTDAEMRSAEIERRLRAVEARASATASAADAERTAAVQASATSASATSAAIAARLRNRLFADLAPGAATGTAEICSLVEALCALERR